jgi:hypothetical protein
MVFLLFFFFFFFFFFFCFFFLKYCGFKKIYTIKNGHFRPPPLTQMLILLLPLYANYPIMQSRITEAVTNLINDLHQTDFSSTSTIPSCANRFCYLPTIITICTSCNRHWFLKPELVLGCFWTQLISFHF